MMLDFIILAASADAVGVAEKIGLRADLALGELRRTLRFAPREAAVQIIPRDDLSLLIHGGARRHSCCGPFGAQTCSSSRIHCTRTGFAYRARKQRGIFGGVVGRQASVAAGAFCENHADVRFGSFSMAATRSRVVNGPCAPVHTVTLSPRTSATAQDGPIIPCI